MFAYLEVRPCIETNGNVLSYRDENEFAQALEAARVAGDEFRSFWSLYGMTAEAMPFGDFQTKEEAHAVMNGFIEFLVSLRFMLEEGEDKEIRENVFRSTADQAVDMINDFINQCSNEERI